MKKDRPTLTRHQIVKRAIKATGCDDRVGRTLMDAVANLIKEAVVRGDDVDLFGIGTLRMHVIDSERGLLKSTRFVPSDRIRSEVYKANVPAHARKRRVIRTHTGDFGSG